MNKNVEIESAEYSKIDDEKLISIIKNGDKKAQDYILDKYKPLVKAKSRAYFLIGADREDIIQEGMIGLYKAIRDFQIDKNTSFRAFAELCVNRQIITAIKAATRQKHIPLNSYVSLNKPVFDEENHMFMDFLKDEENANPEMLLIGQENKNFIEYRINQTLSEFESTILYYYLKGKTYFEISQIIDKSEKSVDNALQRIKKKIEKFLLEKKLDA